MSAAFGFASCRSPVGETHVDVFCMSNFSIKTVFDSTGEFEFWGPAAFW